MRRPAVAVLATSLAASVLGIAPATHAAPGPGSIAGHLEHAGQPVADDALAVAWKLVGDDWDYAGEGWPDAQGDYLIDELDAGDYRVSFESPSSTYVDEAYDDVTDWDLAETLTVAGGESLTGIDADLALGGDIEGTVEDASGQPVNGASVSLFTEEPTSGGGTEWTYARYGTETDALGHYTLDGLPADTYRVEFQAEGYQVEYFDDAALVEDAEDVLVEEGQSVAGIDAELTEDATISGVVTDADDAPLADVWVRAEAPGTEEVDYAQTDEAGSYTLDGLAADSYIVSFDFVDEDEDEFLYEYFDNVGDVEDATPVVVVAGEARDGIDAQLVAGEHDPVPLPQVVNVTQPSISGTPQVGSPLTVSAGTWSPTPTLVEYYWVSDDDLLQGGTSATYVPTAADLGKTISVWVYASADGYQYGYSHVVTSGPVVAAPVVVPPTPPTTTPTVDVPTALAALVAHLDVAGKPKVGRTLKLTGLDKILPRATGVSYRFQWFAGSKKIKKATKSKLKVTKAMKGKKISVKVTATASSTSKTVKIKVGKVR